MKDDAISNSVARGGNLNQTMQSWNSYSKERLLSRKSAENRINNKTVEFKINSSLDRLNLDDLGPSHPVNLIQKFKEQVRPNTSASYQISRDQTQRKDLINSKIGNGVEAKNGQAVTSFFYTQNLPSDRTIPGEIADPSHY